MKKLLGIVFLGLLLSLFNTKTEAANWKFCYKNISGYGDVASIKISNCGKDLIEITATQFITMRLSYGINYDENALTLNYKKKYFNRELNRIIKEFKIYKLNSQIIYETIEDNKLFASLYDGNKTLDDGNKTLDDEKIVAFASGSGFFVSRTGHIVTNQHVIDQCKAVKVNYKGNEIEAKVLAEDKTNDLAILQANITPDKVYSVSNEDVSLLQDIIVAGFPLGKRVSAAIKTHKGNVSALAGYGDNYSNFQTDATINQGNSGGPVMDEKGNVVGVAVALMSVDAGQNIFFAVKSSTLKTFASSNGLSFLPPNKRDLSNKELGQLITEGTVFLECWMTIAKIKQIIAQEENRRAFYSEYQ